MRPITECHSQFLNFPIQLRDYPIARLLNQKASIPHDLLFVDPDVEAGTDDVDVGGRVPVGAGVGAVRVPEGDVNARELLVLQDVADDVRELDVGADGELADAIGVLVGVRVGPERRLQLLVCRRTPR